ncbi:DMT family transporter [Priestia filamentosa]|uniref:DMT family transporter n=1 Tax=Priestia filamentosa TaxID=1402861 RepID=UPI001FB2F30C|nr:DMT family transporter [Priestia filamentosa]UOE62469.1 DMT family transporter [Priestia filamentosa]
MLSEKKVTLLAVLSTILISSKVIVVKQLLNQGMSADQILFLRMLMATPIFLLIYIFYKKKSSKKMSSTDLVLISIVGIFGFFLSPLFDFKGTNYIPATIERVLIFSYPLFIFIFSIFIGSRKPKITHFIMLLFIFIGLYLSVNGISSHPLTNISIKGVILVLIAAGFYAISLIISQRVVHRVGSLNLTVLSEIAAFLIITIYFGINKWIHPIEDTHIRSSSYILLFIMVIFCTVIPFFLLNECIKHIGATKVSLLSIIGPISTTFLDVILLKEILSIYQITGIILVLLSIYFLDFYDKKAEKTKVYPSENQSRY